MSITQAPGWLRDNSSRLMTGGVVVALLYFGRSVYTLALAVVLSLLVAPWVRVLRGSELAGPLQ